jgi:hypothetical protein
MAKNRANDEARRAVLREWDAWASENPEDAKAGMAGMMFFAYLQRKRPELLDFKYPGADKWQQVSAWLSSGSRIKD